MTEIVKTATMKGISQPYKPEAARENAAQSTNLLTLNFTAMKIKTENGEVNVASQGQSTLNTVLGAVGTAGSMGILSGILGGNRTLSRNRLTA